MFIESRFVRKENARGRGGGGINRRRIFFRGVVENPNGKIFKGSISEGGVIEVRMPKWLTDKS